MVEDSINMNSEKVWDEYYIPSMFLIDGTVKRNANTVWNTWGCLSK